MPPLRRRRCSVLCDQLLYLDLSWTEIEDFFLGDPAPGQRVGKSAGGHIDINKIDEQAFRRQFRFYKEDLQVLTEALKIPMIRSSQGVTVSRQEALLMGLRRLTWWDLEPLFGRHSSALSNIVSQLFGHIDSTFGHLLVDVNNHSWLSLNDLKEYSEAVYNRGAPVRNCWGFVDGTARPICRPTVNQRIYFSGHKRQHSVKYQSVMCANGIVCQLDGPYIGHKHDAGQCAFIYYTVC
ncbi:hypothetical protein HPB51_019508 [Rhipicephalus microplus]|uniref:DDE Tnp4 domain-containing protein n=1 Tax=Rhipicephalus microplus TaxID=6941 RepID=A0A9J6EBY1_RHIMP|nr:hypothetical protein HPB51_019508 [Rhipicephalus microplus]